MVEHAHHTLELLSPYAKTSSIHPIISVGGSQDLPVLIGFAQLHQLLLAKRIATTI